MNAQTISVLYQTESFSVGYSKLYNTSEKFREIISPYIESGADIQNLQLRILYEKFNARDVRNFLKMVQNQKNDVHSNEISEICKLAKLFQISSLYEKSLNYVKNKIDPNFTVLDDFENNGQKALEIQYLNGQMQHSYSTNKIEINNTNAVLNTISNMTSLSKSNENFTAKANNSNSENYNSNLNFSSNNANFNSNLSNSNANFNSNLSSSNESFNSNLSNSNANFNSNLSNSSGNYSSNLSNSNENFNSNLSNSSGNYSSNLSNSNENFNSNLSNSNESFNSNLSSSNEYLNSSLNLSSGVENFSGENSSSSNRPYCIVYKIQIFDPLMKCCRYFFTLDGQFLFTGKKKKNEIYIGKGNDIHIRDEKGSCARIMQCDGYNSIYTNDQEFKVTFIPLNEKKQFSLETSFLLNGKTIYWCPKEIDFTLNGQYNHVPIPSKKNMLLKNLSGSPTFIVRKMDNEVFEVECLSIVDPLIAFTIGLSQIVGPFLK